MKKFLTILSAVLIANLFSVAAFAEDAPPGIPDPFGGSDSSAPPTLQLNTGSSGSSGSSSGSSTSTKTTTTTTTPKTTTTAKDREISETGPEMIYLILLGLLLIGGYQFAMKRK